MKTYVRDRGEAGWRKIAARIYRTAFRSNP